jgi:hypothetical protein
MQTIAQENSLAGIITTHHAGSGRAQWTGRAISGLAVAFLIFDCAGKLFEVQPVIDGTKQLGYPLGVRRAGEKVGRSLTAAW